MARRTIGAAPGLVGVGLAVGVSGASFAASSSWDTWAKFASSSTALCAQQKALVDSTWT